MKYGVKEMKRGSKGSDEGLFTSFISAIHPFLFHRLRNFSTLHLCFFTFLIFLLSVLVSAKRSLEHGEPTKESETSRKSTKAFFEGVEMWKKETVLKKEFARHLESSFTTRSQDVTASKLLRANKNKYDLVISDVYMRDMDGFKLLELVGLEMDLPVMMLSASGEACDERSEVAGFDQNGKINKKRNHQNENEERDENGHDNKDPSTQKKPRVAWTHELHYNFVEAVNQLGIDSRTHQLWLDISLKFFASMDLKSWG